MTESPPEDATVTLVLTRFVLRHWWTSPQLKYRYRKIENEVQHAGEGLVFSRLLRESATCYVALSVWQSPFRMVLSATPSHVSAVRASRKWCKSILTTQWHLTRVSPTARGSDSTGVDWWSVAMSSSAAHGWAGAITGCSGR